MNERSLYDILGVNTDATVQEIKKAYSRIATANHPDKANDNADAELYNDATRAYKTLKDIDSRRQYDATGDKTGRNAKQAMVLSVLAEKAAGLIMDHNFATTVDYVGDLTKAVERGISQARVNRARIAMDKERLEPMISRFEGPLFVGTIHHQIEVLEKQLRDTDDVIEQLQTGLYILSECAFTPDSFLGNPYGPWQTYQDPETNIK